MKAKFPFRSLCLGILLGAMTAIGGCVPVSVEQVGAKPSAIKADKTSKWELLIRLEEPAATTVDGRFFLYRYEKVRRWLNVLLWPFRTEEGLRAVSTSRRRGVLLIEFDQNDIVKHTALHKCEGLSSRAGDRISSRADRGTRDPICMLPNKNALWVMIEEFVGQDRAALYRQELVGSLASSLHQAVVLRDLGGVSKLIVQGANINAQVAGYTPLHAAIREGHTDVVKLLLANGANVNAQAAGGTPLHMAIREGQTDVVELLIAKGANIDAIEALYLRTPLHATAEKGDAAVVKVLIAKGVNVNTEDKDGRTPLHLASREGHVAVVNLLLAHGADVNVEDKSGFTPLYMAIGRSKKIIKILKRHGANKHFNQ